MSPRHVYLWAMLAHASCGGGAAAPGLVEDRVDAADVESSDADVADTRDIGGVEPDDIRTDTNTPCPDGFSLAFEPPLGHWTIPYVPQSACDCSASSPSCHAIYSGRAVAATGHEVLLEGRKVDTSNGPGPSVSVAAWVVRPPSERLQCDLLDAYPTAWTGMWPAEIPVHVTVAAWPSAEALAAAPCGDERRLAFVSGGSDGPSERRWFQPEAIRVRKVCACEVPDQAGCGSCTIGECVAETCAEPPRDLLWGVGEPVVWNTLGAKGWSLEEQLDAALALRPEVLRLWMDVGHVLSSPTAVREDNVALYREAITTLQDAGAVVVVMDSGFVSWMTGVEDQAIPCPDAAPASAYQAFLAAWEESWRKKAELFPTVTHWEIGNEWNSGAPFLYPSASCDADGELTFAERARVSLDLMFRGKRGVEAARPDAFVFMPGLSTYETRSFLTTLYELIASGEGPSDDPRDYFDGAAWHPYTGEAPGSAWGAWNEALHEVLVEHGDGGVPVFLSEVGFTDLGEPATRDVHADWLIASVRELRELPWVWGVAWFRAFDDPAYPIGHGERGFGVMAEAPTYAWKPSAYAFWSVIANPRPPDTRWAIELTRGGDGLAVEGATTRSSGGWLWVSPTTGTVTLATPALEAFERDAVVEIALATDASTIRVLTDSDTGRDPIASTQNLDTTLHPQLLRWSISSRNHPAKLVIELVDATAIGLDSIRVATLNSPASTPN